MQDTGGASAGGGSGNGHASERDAVACLGDGDRPGEAAGTTETSGAKSDATRRRNFMQTMRGVQRLVSDRYDTEGEEFLIIAKRPGYGIQHFCVGRKVRVHTRVLEVFCSHSPFVMPTDAGSRSCYADRAEFGQFFDGSKAVHRRYQSL